MNTEISYPTLSAGSTVKIEKGCAARNVTKGSKAQVIAVEQLGADHSHFVRVVLSFNGRVISFYVRHANRLSQFEVSMNTGNPLHRIVVRRA